jgi:5-methylcytosine-specific restriction protein B
MGAFHPNHHITTTFKPMNKILYGPPGTGKTYKLKAEYFDNYITRKTSITEEQHFIEIVRPLTWWQVIGIALIEDGTSSVGEMMSNRWVAQKAAFSESKNVRATLWGTLQMHTIEASTTVSYTQRQSPLIFNKNNDKTWVIIESEAREQAPELYEILESVRNFNPKANEEIKRYVFTTFHQSFSYEDFIEGIKPIITEGESSGLIGYEIQNGIFKELCLRAASDPENRYAIFIDEINRGNVSAIFGELITLIEIDKRKNGANPMSVTLPYSKKSFIVPSNVDIIGTMNTADRSVESLDTALRRRFTFEEMLPTPELLIQEVEKISLKTLLEVMNQRIEVLVDRDHTIGHAFFMNINSLDDLRKTFANKVIPLLQEYFYGDYSKMEMVIGSAFFHRTDVSKVTFAVAPENFYPEGKVYHILNISDKEVMSDEAFISALATLITGKA